MSIYIYISNALLKNFKKLQKSVEPAYIGVPQNRTFLWQQKKLYNWNFLYIVQPARIRGTQK